VSGLFSTGVADNGTLLAEGAQDPHYQLIASADPAFPGPAAFVVLSTGHPIPNDWLANGPTSQWIAPQANQDENNGGGNLQGSYVYQTTFTVNGPNPNSVTISGRMLTDDSVTDVLINGHSTGITAANHTIFSPFTLPQGFFVAGTNTLEFNLTNAGFSPVNPTGLRVDFAAVPEPAAVTLMGIGSVATAVSAARGRRAKKESSRDPKG
jgi:hypothetical protein